MKNIKQSSGPNLNDKDNNIQNSLSRRSFMKQSLAASAGVVASTGIIGAAPSVQKTTAKPAIKITDLRCAIMGKSPVIRITTDAGISGYGQAETAKSYLKPFVMFYKDYLIGEDPTNVERVMMKIRRMGSFKPWGAAVSAIEIALWDIAGKAAGVPVHKLLGGKIRDKVRCYNTNYSLKKADAQPKDYVEYGANLKAQKYGFTIFKVAVGFHGGMSRIVPDFTYGTTNSNFRGPLTEHGLKYMIDCVAALKEGIGDDRIGLALDMGPGFMLSDAIRVANAMEPFNLMWLEDMLTGDYTPYVMADDYCELTRSTTTPIHTGEQNYLRQNFRELIDKHAVRILGPDPEDVGGIAELKWIGEYADIHGLQIAPHGIFDGVIGNAAQAQVGSTMPENFIAFECCLPNPEWWFDIVDGIPDPLVKDGFYEVSDRPGLGVEFNVKAAKQYLEEEDKKFFD
jgi:L-alanine-DL-glutamate epimerase-like enolase superfamily enzyme